MATERTIAECSGHIVELCRRVNGFDLSWRSNIRERLLFPLFIYKSHGIESLPNLDLLVSLHSVT
jgi:hypothetical protein